jgi:putative transposase
MKRARFSEEQIGKEHEAGRKVAELAREHGISEATLYGWKTSTSGDVPSWLNATATGAF